MGSSTEQEGFGHQGDQLPCQKEAQPVKVCGVAMERVEVTESVVEMLGDCCPR